MKMSKMTKNCGPWVEHKRLGLAVRNCETRSGTGVVMTVRRSTRGWSFMIQGGRGIVASGSRKTKSAAMRAAMVKS